MPTPDDINPDENSRKHISSSEVTHTSLASVEDDEGSTFSLTAHRRHFAARGFGRWGRVVALAVLAMVWIYAMRTMEPEKSAPSSKTFDNALFLRLADYAVKKGSLPLPEKQLRLAFDCRDGRATGGFALIRLAGEHTHVGLVLTHQKKGFVFRTLAGGLVTADWALSFDDACREKAMQAWKDGTLLCVATLSITAEGRTPSPDESSWLYWTVDVEIHEANAWQLLKDGRGVLLGRATLTPRPVSSPASNNP